MAGHVVAAGPKGLHHCQRKGSPVRRCMCMGSESECEGKGGVYNMKIQRMYAYNLRMQGCSRGVHVCGVGSRLAVDSWPPGSEGAHRQPLPCCAGSKHVC